jgi:hypothetical protein
MSYTLHRDDALTVLKTLPDESVYAAIPIRAIPADHQLVPHQPYRACQVRRHDRIQA